MKKIKVRLPATLTDFSPALRSLGLAIALYLQVEFIPRNDTQYILETSGEGADAYPLDVQHPVLLGMMRIFQKRERAPLGFTIRVNNAIPLNSGLGAEAAFYTAGIVGANNLIDVPFRRDELVKIVAEVTPIPAAGVASMLGGLTTYFTDTQGTHFRQLPVQALRLVVAIPQIEKYKTPSLPNKVAAEDAILNLQRLPILLEALREGNLALLSRVLHDAIYAPQIHAQLIGYDSIADFARNAGALAICTSGGGPASIFFVDEYPERLAELLEIEYSKLGLSVRTMVVSIDTQGIVIGMMQLST